MRAGHWARCEVRKEHKGVDMMFWKTPDYKFDFCHFCLFAIQKENGTLTISRGMPLNHRPDSKPEKDSL